eukprot:669317-Rhodomonas_salina.1
MRPEELRDLMAGREGMVLLTPDERSAQLQELCGEQQLVLGVREAKGLEFEEVAVVDVFCSLSKHLQHCWKAMLLADEEQGARLAFRYTFGPDRPLSLSSRPPSLSQSQP